MAFAARDGLHIDHGRPPRIPGGWARTGVAGRPDGSAAVGRRRGRLHEAALRALDLVVAVVGLVVAAPVFLAVAVAVALDSPGPVFYRQIRVGKDHRRKPATGRPDSDRRTGDLGGRPFVLYKFRTMRVDAEAECGPTWGSAGDDRTTRVGRFLRRHRLDELPQLWNVLRGDMSLVGPRPERPSIFQRLRDEVAGYSLRQTVRPGITGWAQINRSKDRSVEDVERKLRYDLEYLERRSLWFDLRIMARTPLVMARPDLVESPARAERGTRDVSGDRPIRADVPA